jgi:hypothetical protein
MGLLWPSCAALPAKATSEGDISFVRVKVGSCSRRVRLHANAPTFSVSHSTTRCCNGSDQPSGQLPGHPPHPMILICRVSEETSILACVRVRVSSGDRDASSLIAASHSLHRYRCLGTEETESGEFSTLHFSFSLSVSFTPQLLLILHTLRNLPFPPTSTVPSSSDADPTRGAPLLSPLRPLLPYNLPSHPFAASGFSTDSARVLATIDANNPTRQIA